MEACAYLETLNPEQRRRNIFRSRAISLIVLPLMKCSRRIRAIVSTIRIPDHLLHDEAGSATDQPVGGQILDVDPPA
jgi:hypothetical protein